MIDFHRRFERVIGQPRPLHSSLRLYSLKVDSVVAGFETQQFYDAVYADEEAIVCVPFVMVDGETVVMPEAMRVLSEDALARIARDVLDFARSHEGRAGGRVAGDDSDLAWIADPASGTAMLGLTSYPRFCALLEPYEAVRARAAGRRVLDLNAGLGDGALLLGSVAGHVDAVTADPRLRRIARRLGREFLRSEVPETQDAYGLVLHFGIEAIHAPSAIGEVRKRSAYGFGSVTSAGDAGRRLLEPYGTPRQVTRVGFEGAGPTTDWEVVFGPAQDAASATPLSGHRSPVNVSGPPLSVLMLLRPSAETVFGGDVVQVQSTAEALRRRGHRVLISTDERPDPRGFDIVHATNLTATLETLAQIRAVRAFAGPIALMPIFLDHADESIWGMEMHAACFFAGMSDTQLEHYLELLAARDLASHAGVKPPARLEPFAGYTAYQREIVGTCDFMIANALVEVHRIFRYLDCKLPFAVAPSATDGSVYGPAARTGFINAYGLEDFVLCTGRIEARKNQLLLDRAMRGFDATLVLIGRNDGIRYGALMRAFGSKNTIVIPHLEERMLAGAYAAARVVALPSWNEVVSLSSLNAAVSEASLVLSRNGYEQEYFGDDAEYCDPGSVKSIRAALERAWSTHHERAERRRALAARVRTDYTWDRSAEVTERAYRRLLAYNPRGRSRLHNAGFSA